MRWKEAGAAERLTSPLAQHMRYRALLALRIKTELPAPVQALVAELAACDRLCDRHKTCGCMKDAGRAIALCSESRRVVHAAQASVRSAEASVLAAAFSNRDAFCTQHARMLDCALAHRAKTEARRLELRRREDALAEHLLGLEGLGTDADRPADVSHLAMNAESMAVACREAVAAYRRWESEGAPEQVVSRTDAAMRAARTALQALALLDPDEDRDAVGPGADGGEEAYLAAMGAAVSALADEERFWARGPCAALPAPHLRAAAVHASGVLAAEAAEVAAQSKMLQGYAAELEHMSGVSMCPEACRDPMVAALKEEVIALEEATWSCQDAKIAFERAVKRKRDPEPCEVELSAKRRRVIEAGLSVRRRMAELAVLARDFPEVLRELRDGLPVCVVNLWFEGRTLASYTSAKPLSVASRNVVYRVQEGERMAIVKEYPVASASLATCLREASFLHRLKHPHIVEVQAIFEDADKQPPCFYMEMPFYQHGQLDDWIREQAPDSASIRRVLQQVVLAVEHLHQNGVVHNDIKPANILIGSDGCARLADFDVSVDTATRTADAVIRATALGGGTLGFIAPEVVQTGATQAADMFAMGATIAAVFPAGDPDRDDMVNKLMALNATARPDAKAALCHAFFKPVFAWQRKIATGRCDACFEEGVRFDAGVRCLSGVHLLCIGCFSAQVRSQSSEDERQRFRENACFVVCQFCPADVPRGFADALVAQHVPDETFALLMRARAQVAELCICAEQEALFRRRLAAMREELAATAATDQEVQRHRLHIAEELLTLKCPRCRHAFYDFDGCFALKCGSCKCGFCAWCLKDCGNDAHAHVLACSVSTRRREYHGSWVQFTAAQRSRRQAAVLAYLEPLGAAVRSGVVRACAVDFADLNLVIQ